MVLDWRLKLFCKQFSLLSNYFYTCKCLDVSRYDWLNPVRHGLAPDSCLHSRAQCSPKTDVRTAHYLGPYCIRIQINRNCFTFATTSSPVSVKSSPSSITAILWFPRTTAIRASIEFLFSFLLLKWTLKHAIGCQTCCVTMSTEPCANFCKL